MSSGSKRFPCSFSLVLKDEEIDDINIKCNTKAKKKMKITDFVLVSKTMKKFTVSFTIHRSMTKILSSAVETGWQVLRYFLYLLLVPLVPKLVKRSECPLERNRYFLNWVTLSVHQKITQMFPLKINPK